MTCGRMHSGISRPSSLGIEVLRSLGSISKSSFPAEITTELQRLCFDSITAFSSDLPSQYFPLLHFLERSLDGFAMWVNNVRIAPQPAFLPGPDFIKRLISILREQIPSLGNAVFFVYVDEYENLGEAQQQIINTWLKHSEPPLVFNIAMKRNGFKSRVTEQGEPLSNIHDYRDIDLEQFEMGSEFPLFAAEILLHRLELAEFSMPPNQGIDGIATEISRLSPAYPEKVLEAARSIFPSLSYSRLSERIVKDSTLRRRLHQRIEKALRARNWLKEDPETFVMDDFPEASVIMPALLSRRSITLEELRNEIRKLQAAKDNRFIGTTAWVHNNLVACLLQIYDGLPRPCPVYSGFSTFCHMARGNLRHFLELSFRALGRSSKARQTLGAIDIDSQAEAARQVAADLLSEIRSFGEHGNNLHAFVLRIGTLFSVAQQQPAQSEPEKTHFSIEGGEAEIQQSDVSFLREAIKWSVLFEEKGTKKKDENEPEGHEYILNPIYSPYFHISFRKKRKLELTATEAKILIGGSFEAVKKLISEYQKRWAVDLEDAPLPLFAHFDTL